MACENAICAVAGSKYRISREIGGRGVELEGTRRVRSHADNWLRHLANDDELRFYTVSHKKHTKIVLVISSTKIN